MQQAAIIVVVSVLCFFGIILLVEFTIQKVNISEDEIALLKFRNPRRHIQKHAEGHQHRRRVPRSTRVETTCKKRSKRDLLSILSVVQIFNPYFASIEKPMDFTSSELSKQDSRVDKEPQFEKWSNLAAFNFSRASHANMFMRRNGDNSNVLMNVPIELPWSCPSSTKWIDLGDDTFPRYVKTATCTKSCWFERMVCQPRSFEMIVLRRKCFVSDKTITNMMKVPDDLEEQWKSEKIAVNFCCECVRGERDQL